MAVHGYHIDEIYDLGIMPIGKNPLTNSSEVQYAKRPGIEFRLPYGTTPGRDLRPAFLAHLRHQRDRRK